VPEGQFPRILGLHHVRIPVTDPLVSRDWYINALGFSPLLVFEVEEGVLGVTIEHPSGVSIGLHKDRKRARSLSGSVVLSLAVSDLAAWAAHLERSGRSPVHLRDAHIGRCIHVPDPDGILISLHTPDWPSVDQA